MAGTRRPEAVALLDTLLERSRHEYVPPALIALIFKQLGDTDNWILWLEKAFAEGSNAIAYLRPDYRHSQMSRDPRFQALLARAGLQ